MAMIETTEGLLEEDTLLLVPGVFEDEREYTTWTEYYLGTKLVRRDVHVTLKAPKAETTIEQGTL